MKTKEFAAFLIEDQEDRDGEEGIRVFVDRLLLRIFSYPSLMTYLQDVSIKGNTVELDFMRVPDAIVSNVKKLIGVPGVKAFSFTKDEYPHTGFRFSVKNPKI